MSDVVRVGMWSGPRNISTAMMRAFENRPDTVVVDEPLYAAYLSRTGIDHPAREAVIAGEFLRAPEAHLRWLCDWLGIPFTARMLSWPAGPRESDGVWAPHWYAAVWSSTGFEPWRPRDTACPVTTLPSPRRAVRSTTRYTRAGCSSEPTWAAGRGWCAGNRR